MNAPLWLLCDVLFIVVNQVGVLKNLLVTYLGMIIGGDYVFSWINFLGLNISVSGSIFYTYITFVEKKIPKKNSMSETSPDSDSTQQTKSQITVT